MIENFFGVIKSELFYVNKFKDIADLESEIHKYIKYYNKERIRLNLNGLTPIEFRKEYLKNII
ncbi:IS3 family transposase [Myroides pelagicus]|uniref:IS3 family transposase n=1 Tax=Myroides pelagicus TaxID=270914 RepID=UPI00398AF142